MMRYGRYLEDVGKRCLVLWTLKMLLLLLLLSFDTDYQNVRTVGAKQLEVYDNAYFTDCPQYNLITYIHYYHEVNSAR
jgi:hypothetical protein